MSGGSMKYLYSKVLHDADFACDTPEREAFAKHLKLVAQALHDIEWVDSDDYGPGDENAAIRACLQGEKSMDKSEALAGQVGRGVRPLCWVGVNKQGDVTHHSNSPSSWAPIPVVQKRQLDIAMRNWEMWKMHALELNERLQKYEPGSPLLLNEAR